MPGYTVSTFFEGAGAAEVDDSPSVDSIPRNVGAFFQHPARTTINEDLRLRLAGKILLGIALISAGALSWYALQPENPALASIFELVKIGVLPLAT